MRLAVCEAPPNMQPGDTGWGRLVAQIKAAESDLFLLNEMPFGRWVSLGTERDPLALGISRQHHREGIANLSQLGTPWVLGTRPTEEGSFSVNEAFVWSSSGDILPVHTKQFFPNEKGFFEARWFERGESKFGIADVGGVRVGFLICTDVMFNEWARYYGRNGAHLIAVPRATPTGSVSRWKTMCTAAAIVSGCYVASSNRAGVDESGLEFAGKGWIFDPTGEVIAETSADAPVVTADLDLDLVKRAQGEYPCYVEELAGGKPTDLVG